MRTPSHLPRRRLRSLVLCLASALPVSLHSQIVPVQWHAQWIVAPDAPARDYDVQYFRRSLTLPLAPAHFIVHVSADNRFELHVNGKRVNAGPALADVQHWRYETYDLAPYLVAGQNQIAAIVWNFGISAPIAQISSQTAFLLSAEDPSNAAVDTGPLWQTHREKGRTLGHADHMDYYAAGPDEIMDGTNITWDWDAPTTDPADPWRPAMPIGHASLRGAQDSPTRWILQKNDLPSMQFTPVSAGHVVRMTGAPSAPTVSLEHPLTIPAHSDVSILLDRDVLTTAYPAIQIEGGQHASVDLTYAEALYDADNHKANRNEIAGRHIAGVHDHILPDGESRTYRPLWWRTWRYLQIDVKTADQPLTIEHMGAFYTAYPFTAVAHFESSDPQLSKIWDVGWRTAQLCSHETYMDTPYWEQLQYVGDTRIQALISYAVTGDDRLARQALLAYQDSLLTDGLTQSRYPSSLTQVIPPFSLLWIGMLHDFSMYRNDPAFTASLLPGTRNVLDWFVARQRADGLLKKIEWWPFVDWSPPLFDGGVPPQDADGGSSALTLQFIAALRDAAELEDKLGEPDRALRYRHQASLASDALMRLNWDPRKALLADTPSHQSFSQQANSLAVLLDVIPQQRHLSVMQQVLASSTPAASQPGTGTVPMSQASYYFRFYVARAMVHAGLGDQYLPQLDPWRQMLALGLSTWAENPEPTRSDSHAWSAHPTLDLLTIVAGIAPASPGFDTVAITPHLGALQHLSATMPTPKGLVEVTYARQSTHWKVAITLPQGLFGNLIWHGHSTPLHPGNQQIDLPE